MVFSTTEYKNPSDSYRRRIPPAGCFGGSSKKKKKEKPLWCFRNIFCEFLERLTFLLAKFYK